jgi:hypothetical protein
VAPVAEGQPRSPVSVLARWRWWHLALVWLAVPLAVALAVALELARREGEVFLIFPFIPWAPSTWAGGVHWLWSNGFGFLATTLSVAPVGALLLTVSVLVARQRSKGRAQEAAAA